MEVRELRKETDAGFSAISSQLESGQAELEALIGNLGSELR
jgi:hypothetical protein